MSAPGSSVIMSGPLASERNMEFAWSCGLAAQAQAARGGAEPGICQGLGQRRLVHPGAVSPLDGQAPERPGTDRLHQAGRRGRKHPAVGGP